MWTRLGPNDPPKIHAEAHRQLASLKKTSSTHGPRRRARGRRDDSARTRRKILISTQRSDAREGGRDRRRADGPTRDEAPRHGLGPRRRVRPEALAVDRAQRRRLVGLARGVLVHVLSWFFFRLASCRWACALIWGVVRALLGEACSNLYSVLSAPRFVRSGSLAASVIRRAETALCRVLAVLYGPPSGRRKRSALRYIASGSARVRHVVRDLECTNLSRLA